MFTISNSKPSTPKRLMTSYEVEKYIEKVQSRLQSPFDKKTKAFGFAQLYYDAKDYELARIYLEDFLTIQDRDFRVYNLLGETYEALDDYQQAFNAYKRSLELCSSQKDILLKVVVLCCKFPIDPLRAKVWADKGSKLCPGHPAVFNLKWQLLSQEKSKNYDEMELLLSDELTRRARESSLHIKLVKMYLDAELYEQAFQHCISVQKTSVFDHEVDWLECICETFEVYKDINDDQKIVSLLHYAQSLVKLLPLHLKLSDIPSCEKALRRLDSFYSDLRNTPISITEHAVELKDCLNEVRGQLYLFGAVYFMKLAKEDILPWMQANRMAASYLMASWQVKAPLITSKLFSRHSPLKKSSVPYHWSVMACYRLSQAGHLILSFESQFGEEWLKNCINDYCNMQGQKTLVDTLYNNQVSQLSQSFLATDETFLQVEAKIPEPNLLIQFNEVAVAENASDLHQIIWLGLHWDNLNEHIKPGVGVIVGRLFEGISLDVKNMKNCHFSNLCLRDIEAFIYAVVRSSKSIHLECSKKGDELKLLPVEICPNLVTSIQQEWWNAAYGLYTGKIGNLCAAKLKVILQKGLETIRCMRDHSIDPRILMYISVAFFEKVVSIESSKKHEYDYQDHWESLNSRAIYYMKEAIKILEVYKSNRVLPATDNPLILPLSEPILPDDVVNMLNKNYIRLADASMVNNNLKDALKYYSEVKSLHSMYNQAQIYIQLAAQSDLETFEGEKDYLYYVTKAKEKLSICISNADHSSELKQSLIKQLQDLQLLNDKTPSTKRSLFLQSHSNALLPEDADVYLESSMFNTSSSETSSFERTILQQQLDAKESENQSLKQTLAMYKAQIDNIQYQQQNVIHAYPSPGYMPPHVHPSLIVPSGIQPALIPLGVNNTLNSKMTPKVSVIRQGMVPFTPPAVQPMDSQVNCNQSFVYQNAQPIPSSILPQVIQTPDAYNMLNVHYAPQQVYMPTAAHNRSCSGTMTPVVSSNGVDSQGSDMWWDSFSPQPSFEKGYFSGLSEHVEQLREKSGDVEAPTLKDDTSKTPQEKERPLSVKGTPNTPALELDDIYVEPIVKLTSQNNLVTGEEGEEEKFVHRAKLYRFDKDSNQWKERGIGEVKILWNDITKKARITMRRDHVFRVCCNHVITPEMFLEKKAGTQAAWSWFTAADASNEDVKPEQFTIRFRTQEKADEFQEIFLKFQKLSGTEKLSATEKFISKDPDHNVKSKPIQIQSKFGSWSCNTCLVSNPSDVNECLACKTANPKIASSVHSQSSENKSTQSTPVFSFNVTSNIKLSPEGKPVFVFANKSSTNIINPFLSQKTPLISATESSSDFQFKLDPSFSEEKVVETKPNPFAGFSFKFNTATTSESTSTKTSSIFSGFSFSSSTSSIVSTGSDISAQNFPIMTSLLLKQTSNKPTTPVKPLIAGMEKLPVFERGVVNSSVDPSSFWTSVSPQKTFFTGNTTGLDSIGHQEEPRVDDAEGASLDEQKNDDSYEEDYYYGEDVEQIDYYDDDGNYYDENGQYYDEENPCEDYDYDPDEDFGYENNEYEPSHASSSRRESWESKENDDNDLETDNLKPSGSELKEVNNGEVQITLDVKPSLEHRDEAKRLLLPETFFLYKNHKPCTGCSGCVGSSSKHKADLNKCKANISNDEFTVQKAEVKKDIFGGKQVTGNAVNLFAELAALPGFSSQASSFSGAGTKLFATEQIENENNEAESEYDPHVESIVQVTKLKNIQTGEEDDEALFKHRCKLYRYVSGQWKERGVGEIKLTKNIVTGYRRIIMRREVIHKLCANHAIMPNMELKPLMSSDKSWVWFTPSDYSEGLPPISSQFCVKFTSIEIANQFKAIFEECQKDMVNVLSNIELKGVESKSLSKIKSENENSSENKTKSESSSKTLAFKFSILPGQWECATCLVRNESNKSSCISCGTMNSKKLDFGEKSDTIMSSSHLPENVSLISSSSSAVVSTQSFSGFQFNVASTISNIPSTGLKTSSTPPLFSFSLKKPEPHTSMSVVSSTLQAMSSDLPVFNKTNLNDCNKSITQTIDKNKPAVAQEEPAHEEENDIFVEAIAHVSKLDQLITGEENDEVMYSNRLKLYRYDLTTKSWKERGIGELKITRDKTNNSCRIVMRREQVHKLCANHAITADMELKPQGKSNKAWVWSTQADISDGEAKSGQFCANFKTSESATDFKLCFDKCKVIVSSKSTSNNQQNIEAKVKNLKSKFVKEGSWSCNTCLVSNQISAQCCVACQSPNPNASSNPSSSVDTSYQKPEVASKNNLFTFGVSSSSTASSSFGASNNQQNIDAKIKNLKSKFNKESNWSCSTCLVSNQISAQCCVACQSPNPNASSNPSLNIDTSCQKSESVLKNSLFTFGVSSSSTTGFSFGAPLNSPSAGFTFAPKTNMYTFGAPVSSSQINELPIKHDSKSVFKQSFEADLNTWECPACLSKNNGSRDVCRECESPKQKAPVVRLDPEQFSKPINFKPDILVNKSDQSFELKNNILISPFDFSTPSIIDSKNKAHVDQLLMPPPRDLPKKTDIKENEKHSAKIDSWMPKGLNTDFTFTFGVSSSPSLSAASSIDDLRIKPDSEQVQSVFGDKPFAFKFDASKELSTITSNNLAPSISSPNKSLEVEDTECSAEFAPLVSLSHINYLTGEEDEVVIFNERSKMFRYDGQWKERGTGDLKILQHKVNKQYRLLLRRDQTHKLSANHMLVKGMVIQPMGTSKNAYVWKSTSDISDGEATEQTFAARFKLEERAKEFADIFKSICSINSFESSETYSTYEAKVTQDVIVIESGDESCERDELKDEDVEITYESKIDNTLINKAKMLLLPETFYNQITNTRQVKFNVTEKNDKESDSKVAEASSDFSESHDFNESHVFFDPQVLYSTSGHLFKHVGDEYQEYTELNKINIVKETRGETAYYITVVDPAGKEQLVMKIMKKHELKMPKDSKIVFKFDTCYGEYALKFRDMPDAENFLFNFENVKKSIEVEELSGDQKSLQTDVDKSNNKVESIFGGSFNKISFASLASSGESGFSSNLGKSFVGFGTALFQTVDKTDNRENDNEDEVNIYVEPIVQLKSITVESGEENECVVFNERCKLYRYDDKKWKERGVGEMKLLRHTETGKARLVMRRDQVHKVCANHLVTSNMRLEPFKNNDLTVTWNAFSDVSDGSPIDCIFAVKFKNLELLSCFKENFLALSEGKLFDHKSTNIVSENSENLPHVLGSCDPSLSEFIKSL
ncbi:E3 SUMO-protein ligase RanBP2 isoform X2 [Hydra vulgaris]|uniref:E3 SUMO-protein ligase RanBP2 isoform X2 n=1 Tax=Hydra vulgaris TaxID=6087 RepID=UPI0032EA015A